MTKERNETLNWIKQNIDTLKVDNESEEIDIIVSKMKDVPVGGAIGLTREMVDGAVSE